MFKFKVYEHDFRFITIVQAWSAELALEKAKKLRNVVAPIVEIVHGPK